MQQEERELKDFKWFPLLESYIRSVYSKRPSLTTFTAIVSLIHSSTAILREEAQAKCSCFRGKLRKNILDAVRFTQKISRNVSFAENTLPFRSCLHLTAPQTYQWKKHSWCAYDFMRRKVFRRRRHGWKVRQVPRHEMAHWSIQELGYPPAGVPAYQRWAKNYLILCKWKLKGDRFRCTTVFERFTRLGLANFMRNLLRGLQFIANSGLCILRAFIQFIRWATNAFNLFIKFFASGIRQSTPFSGKAAGHGTEHADLDRKSVV